MMSQTHANMCLSGLCICCCHLDHCALLLLVSSLLLHDNFVVWNALRQPHKRASQLPLHKPKHSGLFSCPNKAMQWDTINIFLLKTDKIRAPSSQPPCSFLLSDICRPGWVRSSSNKRRSRYVFTYIVSSCFPKKSTVYFESKREDATVVGSPTQKHVNTIVARYHDHFGLKLYWIGSFSLIVAIFCCCHFVTQ